MQISMTFFGYWKMRLLNGKREANRWRKVYEVLSELDELERGIVYTNARKLKGAAQCERNKLKVP